MEKILHIIHLEDQHEDAELVAYILKKEAINCIIHRAAGKQEFLQLLSNSHPDLILSDHSLPSFNSLEALQLTRNRHADIPFILVTSTMPEEEAVQLMKEGATDYILKDRMQRLPAAITAALKQHETEKTLARQKQLQEKLVLRTSIRAQEKVRHEIGIELHDNINQILAASKLFLDKALQQKNNREELLKRSKEYLENAIDEIRRLSHQMVTPSVESLSLYQVIRDLIDDIQQSSALEVHFSADEIDEETISREIKLTLFRIIQEQLHNILKHSEATQALIKMYTLNNTLVLMVRDNGKGAFNESKNNGIGLNNIKNRVEYFDGELSIYTKPGKGFSLKVIVPFTAYNHLVAV